MGNMNWLSKQRESLEAPGSQHWWRFGLWRSKLSHPFEISGLLVGGSVWSHFMFCFVGCCLCFFLQPRVLQLFVRCCFAVNLQKCLVHSASFHWHRGRADNDSIFHFFCMNVIGRILKVVWGWRNYPQEGERLFTESKIHNIMSISKRKM